MQRNASHGNRAEKPKPFHTLMDLPAVIEKVLVAHGIRFITASNHRSISVKMATMWPNPGCAAANADGRRGCNRRVSWWPSLNSDGEAPLLTCFWRPPRFKTPLERKSTICHSTFVAPPTIHRSVRRNCAISSPASKITWTTWQRSEHEYQ